MIVGFGSIWVFGSIWDYFEILVGVGGSNLVSLRFWWK